MSEPILGRHVALTPTVPADLQQLPALRWIDGTEVNASVREQHSSEGGSLPLYTVRGLNGGVPVGVIALRQMDPRSGTASMDVTLAHGAGTGPWAAEATLLFLDEVLRSLALRKIYVELPASGIDNFASVLGAGVVVEAILRAHRKMGDRIQDWALVAIYCEDVRDAVRNSCDRLKGTVGSDSDERTVLSVPGAGDSRGTSGPLHEASHTSPNTGDVKAWMLSSDGQTVPPMASHRTLLRPLTEADVNHVYELSLANDMAHLWRYRGATPGPQRFRESLWNGVLAQFAIVRRSDSKLVGLVYAYNANLTHGHAYVGLMVAGVPGRSVLAMEAMLLFNNYLFGSFPLIKVYAETSERSATSFQSAIGRVLAVEGRLRDHEYFNGEYFDLLILAGWRDIWCAIAAERLPQIGAAAGATSGSIVAATRFV